LKVSCSREPTRRDSRPARLEEREGKSGTHGERLHILMLLNNCNVHTSSRDPSNANNLSSSSLLNRHLLQPNPTEQLGHLPLSNLLSLRIQRDELGSNPDTPTLDSSEVERSDVGIGVDLGGEHREGFLSIQSFGRRDLLEDHVEERDHIRCWRDVGSFLLGGRDGWRVDGSPSLLGGSVDERVFHLLVRGSESAEEVENVGIDLSGSSGGSIGFVHDDDGPGKG